MADPSVRDLVSDLLMKYDGDADRAAKSIGTSKASLSRWLSGQAQPDESFGKRLDDELSDCRRGEPPTAHHAKLDQRADLLETAISSTLNALREEFHAKASVSSRQEVLDLVSALFFAHVASIEHGGRGICSDILLGGSAVRALNSFVIEAIGRWLPQPSGLGGRGIVDPRSYFRSLTEADAAFATAVVGIFERDAKPFLDLHQAGRDDLMNEVFSRFMSGSFVDEKEMGQYLTPPEIVRFMVEIGLHALHADARALMSSGTSGLILDPSCGVGSFLAEVTRQLTNSVRLERGSIESSRWMTEFAAHNVVGIDKSERMLRLASINMGLFGSDRVRLIQANSLARSGEDGTIADNLVGRIELILTNPPFGASHGGADLLKYKTAKGRNKAESELLFVERYFDWLVPGGVLVAVLPDSVLVNQGVFADLRRWLSKRGRLEAVVSLPANTFAAAGTTTKTSVVLLRKAEQSGHDQEAYFAVANDVGYDVQTRGGQRRRVRSGRDDLSAIASEYIGRVPREKGRTVVVGGDARWDAGFHAGMTEALTALVESSDSSLVRVADVARLVDERADPRKLASKTFQYIEISDVEPRAGYVGSKEIASIDAPSRARKRVREGDVILSTVRPERGAIGVVPKRLDGAICSTGFAVLRTTDFAPNVLAGLLRSAFVKQQMLRHNVGIAYPAIAEKTCLDLMLPATIQGLSALGRASSELDEAQRRFEEASAAFEAALLRVSGEGSRQFPNFVEAGEPTSVADVA